METRWPLTPQQRDLWLAQALDGPSSAFTIPLWVELPPEDQWADFRPGPGGAWPKRLRALRTRLHPKDGAAWQSFPADGGPRLEHVDLADRANPEAAAWELTRQTDD